MKYRTIRAVLFDFDGTLTRAGAIDFEEMRKAIGCPPEASILSFIDEIVDPAERLRVEGIVDEMESEAAGRAEEQPGASELVASLKRHAIGRGIITRNSRSSLDRSFSRFRDLRASDFDVILTRDDPVEPKPSPAGVLQACAILGCAPVESLVVGDFSYDVEAGSRAGAATVLFDSAPEREFERPASDYLVHTLFELIELVELLRPLPAGKLPNGLLGRLLSELPQGNPFGDHAAGSRRGYCGS